MKNIAQMLVFLFASIVVTSALADEPCPTSAAQPNPAVREGCKPDLSKPAPVRFEFPKDDAKPDAAKPSDDKADAAKPDAAKPAPAARVTPQTCTYSAYAWDTRRGRSTDHFRVSKPYSEVTDDERDPNVPDCTICTEDQVTIDTSEFGLKAGKIRVCHVYAEQVRNAFREIVKAGDFDIEKLDGYRPGKTRGPVDANGLRTVWSQHSFGTAIDINAHRNAMYNRCPNPVRNSADDVKTCKRSMGGDYNPQKYPRLAIVKDGTVYRAMTKFWKWGGEIEGDLKDIMHFSVTGY